MAIITISVDEATKSQLKATAEMHGIQIDGRASNEKIIEALKAAELVSEDGTFRTIEEMQEAPSTSKGPQSIRRSKKYGEEIYCEITSAPGEFQGKDPFVAVSINGVQFQIPLGVAVWMPMSHYTYLSKLKSPRVREYEEEGVTKYMTYTVSKYSFSFPTPPEGK